MFIELLTSSRGQHASHLHCQEGDTTKDSSNELDAAMAHFLFGHMSQGELKLKLSCLAVVAVVVGSTSCILMMPVAVADACAVGIRHSCSNCHQNVYG